MVWLFRIILRFQVIRYALKLVQQVLMETCSTIIVIIAKKDVLIAPMILLTALLVLQQEAMITLRPTILMRV